MGMLVRSDAYHRPDEKKYPATETTRDRTIF